MSAKLKIGIGLAILVLVLVLSFIGPALNRIPDAGIQTGHRELLVRVWGELSNYRKENGAFPVEFHLEENFRSQPNNNFEYFSPPNRVWGENDVLVAAPPIELGSEKIRLVLKEGGVIKKVVKE